MIFKNFDAIISSSKDFNLNIVIDSDYELFKGIWLSYKYYKREEEFFSCYITYEEVGVPVQSWKIYQPTETTINELSVAVLEWIYNNRDKIHR